MSPYGVAGPPRVKKILERKNKFTRAMNGDFLYSLTLHQSVCQSDGDGT